MQSNLLLEKVLGLLLVKIVIENGIFEEESAKFCCVVLRFSYQDGIYFFLFPFFVIFSPCLAKRFLF